MHSLIIAIFSICEFIKTVSINTMSMAVHVLLDPEDT